jgi:Zn-dependent M16 (insulinase) family peptidase
LGIGEQDYLATQSWQANVCGSINAYSTMRSDIDDEQSIKSYLILSSKALARNQQQQAELMQQTLQSVRFDELTRLQELLGQQRARREQSVTNNGHSLAMSAASSGMNPSAHLNHTLSGLAGIQAIKHLDESLQTEQGLQKYADHLQQLHQLMLQAPRQLLLIAEADRLTQCQQTIADLWQQQPQQKKTRPFTPEKIRQQIKQLWIANSQVNFCAKAYPTVPGDHPDAAALSVLGGFLRNGFLHRSIREQGGAYGGGASQDSNSASFRFYSYRDPRLQETLADFDAAIQWLQETEHEPEQLEQAILGVISSMDKPGSPAGEAKQDFHNHLFGRSNEDRRRFRQRILQVSLEDLKRVGQLYLKTELASTAIITNQATFEQLGNFVSDNDMKVFNL